MRIEIRNNEVTLDGYVNVVDRYSRPIVENGTKFIEKILPGAFKRALARNHNIDWYLNHNKEKKLGSTTEDNIELYEDNVGLRAICKTTDAYIIECAKNNQLRGWSFGFEYIDKIDEVGGNGMLQRSVSELQLNEVSIIDMNKIPCYIGTSVELRANEEIEVQIRSENFEAITYDNTKEDQPLKVDFSYDEYEKIIHDLNK